MALLILLLSNLFQIVACIYVSIQFVKSKLFSGWGILFVVIWLMSLRRMITLVNIITLDKVIDIYAEIVALIISALLTLLLFWINSLFKNIHTLQDELSYENIQKGEVGLALRKSEERYRLAEQAVKDGIWDWDLITNRLHLSPRWKEILGYETDELDSWSKITNELVHPKHQSNLNQGISNHFKLDTEFDLEVQMKHKDGTYKWIKIRGTALRDDQNKVIRMVGAIADINKRKEAELFVELENELLRSMSSDVPIGNLLEYLILSIESQHKDFYASILYMDLSEIQNCEIVAPNLPIEILEEAAFRTVGTRSLMSNVVFIRNDADFEEELSSSEDWDHLKGHLDEMDIKSYWSFPIHDDNQNVWGMIDLYSKNAGLPSEDEYLMIESAQQLALRIIVQHREEQSHNQIQSLYQTIFEQAAVGVALVESNSGALLQVNDRLCQILGYSQEDAPGLTLNNLVYGEDLDLIINESLQFYRGERGEFKIELRFVHKKGYIFWGEVSASQLWQKQKNRNTYVAVFQEITSRKNIEENLRFHSEVLENIEECVIIVGCYDKRILYSNTKFDKMFGYDEKEIIGKKVNCLISKDNTLNQMSARDILHTLNKVGQWKGELKNVKKDGAPFWSRVNVSYYEHPMFGKAWVCISDDISMLREAEDSVIKMEKLEGIGVLAGGIAHDFNNIMVGIFANLSMLQDKLGHDHDGLPLLKEALGAMQRAKGLTSQLLTFSKGGEPIKESTDIARLIEGIIQFDLSGSNIKPIIDKAENLRNVDIDKGQIQQVFSNLTINAKDAMPDGGHIFCKIENWRNEDVNYVNLPIGNYVKITFQDEGIGIDLKNLGQIFDPYYTTKDKGNGLGLTTTFSIIKRHGGHIMVDSKINQGTIFSILLPASIKNNNNYNREIESQEKRSLEGIKILIMDDQEMILKAVSQILGDQGIITDKAKEGERAIHLYKKSCQSKELNYDLVILDLTIPGGTGGKEVIQEILKLNPNAKVLASSGYTDGDIMANYRAHGFTGIVPKPYTMDELLDAIQLVLNVN